MLLTFLVLCAVLAVGMLFAVQNTVEVPLDLLIIQLSPKSVALWILLAFAVGGIIGMLTSLGLVVRLRTALMRANRKLTQAERARVKMEASPAVEAEKSPPAVEKPADQQAPQLTEQTPGKAA